MYLHFTNLAVKMKLSFAANLLLLSSLSVLLSIAIADPLVVGTEPLNASELTSACVSEHGLLYRVGRGSQGYIAVAGQDDEGQAGVMVVQSAIGKHAIHCPSMATQPLATQGGGCKAKAFQACNMSEDGCALLVSCDDSQGSQQRCQACQPAKFQRRFRARVGLHGHSTVIPFSAIFCVGGNRTENV